MIVDYNGGKGNSGCFFVGHAALLLQDSNKVWYFTEFTGDKKKNAKVYLTKENRYTGDNNIRKILSLKIKGCQFLTIQGDFTNSLTLAKKYMENYKKYNLLWNNCLSYCIKILNAGKLKNSLAQYYLLQTSVFIPSQFYTRFKKILEMKDTNYNRWRINLGLL